MANNFGMKMHHSKPAARGVTVLYMHYQSAYVKQDHHMQEAASIPLKFIQLSTVNIAEIMALLGGNWKVYSGPLTYIFAPLLLVWFYQEMAAYFLRKKMLKQSRVSKLHT